LIAAIVWIVVRDSNPLHPVQFHHVATTMKEVLSGLLRVIGSYQLWIIGAVGCLFYLFLSAFAEISAPNWLHQVHHLSSSRAANATSMVFLGCAVGAPVWGLISDYFRRRRTPMIVASTGALITFCALLYIRNLPIGALYTLLFLLGFLSSVQILVFAVARELTPIRSAGTAIGMINMLVMISGLVFPPLIGKLLDLNWNGLIEQGARVYSAGTYTLAYTALPIGIFIGILLTLLIRETYCIVNYPGSESK